MAGSVNDKITRTRNGARPNSARVTGSRTAGASSLSCDNLAGWPTSATTAVKGVTYKIDTNNNVIAGSQLDFKGLVSGNNIGSFTIVDGTDNGNAIGDVVEMLPTADWGDDLATALQKEHSQLDGSHTGINSTSITNTGAFNQTGATTLNGSWDGWVGANESWAFASSTTITVPTDATTKYDVGDFIKITQSATVKYFVITTVAATLLTVTGMNSASPETVANSVISNPAYSKARSPHGLPGGINGVWQTFTPTWANLTIGNATVTARYTQTGKTVSGFIKVVFGSTSAMGTGPTFTAPVTGASQYGTGAYNFIGVGYTEDAGVSASNCALAFNASTTVIALMTLNVAGTYGNWLPVSPGVPITFGTGDFFNATFTYEAI